MSPADAAPALTTPAHSIAILGAGPAGLAAAEQLSAAGHAVQLFDAMPSPGRKFLLAGRGGLNLTHSEPYAQFLSRYGSRAAALQPMLDAFPPEALRAWVAGLGLDTFVGSSGRVFPVGMKAAPLLRAWLRRLQAQGVQLHPRHRWLGWAADGALRLATPTGEILLRPQATVLALGGASWPRLGSDGVWQALLAAQGVALAPLQPANCGFDVLGGWSEHLRTRFAGQPVKPVALAFEGWRQAGEFVLTDTGIEGSLVYAASQRLREALARHGRATLHLDLLPQHSLAQVQSALARGRGSRSLGSQLKSLFSLSPPKSALLHEVTPPAARHDTAALAERLKALPLTVAAARPVAEAISTAGGVCFEALGTDGRLQGLPPGWSPVWPSGEMLDWEAPTGGYLLNACLAHGRWVGGQVATALQTRSPRHA